MKPRKIGRSFSAAFSADGNTLATVGRDVWTWDVAHHRKLFRAHPFSHPSDVDFSPDGGTLAVKSTSGRIALISSESGETVRDFRNAADGEGSNVLYSACGEYVVDGTWDGRLSVRRAASGAREFLADFPGEMIREVHRCDGGARWVVAHGPKATTDDQPPAPDYFSIWTWPFAAGRYELSDLRVPFSRASSISPDRQLIAVVHGAPPDFLSVFNLATGRPMDRVHLKAGGTEGAIAWSVDGKLIACAQNEAVVFYTFPGLTMVHEVPMEYPCDVAFAPNGTFVALGSWTAGWLVEMQTLSQALSISLTPTASA